MFSMSDLWSIQIPAPMALAAVALCGYLFSRSRKSVAESDPSVAHRQLERAKAVAKELEQIADVLRSDLAAHHTSIARFKDRVENLAGSEDGDWKELFDKTEQILKPTMRLASQVTHAYDSIRQQTNQLMAFTEARTDPLTGINNRRALDESLESMFALRSRYDHPFSVVIIDIDHFKRINDSFGHQEGDRALKEIATKIDHFIRDSDLVARYGGEEFVVVLPNTELEGAARFADRLRGDIEAMAEITISAGVATAGIEDDADSLMVRADTALYAAKTAGRNTVFHHDGTSVIAHAKQPALPCPAESTDASEATPVDR